MWNAEFKLGPTGPDLPEVEVRPEFEPLPPKTRLEAIASILALAVLRRRVRTGRFPERSSEYRKIQRKVREGLDSSCEQSVHA